MVVETPTAEIPAVPTQSPLAAAGTLPPAATPIVESQSSPTPNVLNQPSVTAEIYVRDPLSGSPATAFPLARATALRWLAEINGMDSQLFVDNKAPASLNAFLTLTSDPANRRQLSVSVLSLGLEESRSVRVGGTFSLLSDSTLQSGKYVLSLELGRKVLAQTSIEIELQ